MRHNYLTEYLLLLMSSLHFIKGRPTNDRSNNEDYLSSTCRNYNGRSQSFTEWAEEEANSKPAARCRQLLEDELANSLERSSSPSSLQEVHFLDAGCGSGRDLAGFYDEKVILNSGKNKLSIKAEGFDCSKGLIEKAKQRGLDATVADFISYFDTIPQDKKFDAIFSLAALFHLPEKKMVKVLSGFHKHLNERGVILTSIPEGSVGTKMGDGRWITALPEEKQKKLLEDAGFDVVHQEKMSIYNGNKWLVLVGRKR